MSDERPTATEPGVAVVGGRAGAAAQAPTRAGDAESGTDGTDGTDGATPTRPALRRRTRTVAPRRAGQPAWLVPLLAAVTVVSVLCAIVFGVKWSDLSAKADTQATVQRVSRDFLTALTNFTAKTVDADFRTISTYATGDFAKQSNQFFGSTIRQQLESAQAWSKGQFRYLYVQSLQDDQATVYAEIDQTYANNKVTQPIADSLQVVLGLTKVGGVWKISAVTVLQPPSSPSAPTGNAGSAVGK